MTIQRLFNDSSVAIQRQFNSYSMVNQQQRTTGVLRRAFFDMKWLLLLLEGTKSFIENGR